MLQCQIPGCPQVEVQGGACMGCSEIVMVLVPASGFTAVAIDIHPAIHQSQVKSGEHPRQQRCEHRAMLQIFGEHLQTFVCTTATDSASNNSKSSALQQWSG